LGVTRTNNSRKPENCCTFCHCRRHETNSFLSATDWESGRKHTIGSFGPRSATSETPQRRVWWRRACGDVRQLGEAGAVSRNN